MLVEDLELVVGAVGLVVPDFDPEHSDSGLALAIQDQRRQKEPVQSSEYSLGLGLHPVVQHPKVPAEQLPLESYTSHYPWLLYQ